MQGPSFCGNNHHVSSQAEENYGEGYFDQTEESNQFRQEYEMRKKKQACKKNKILLIR